MPAIVCCFLLVPACSPISQQSGSLIDLGDHQGCTSFCLENGGFAVFGTNYDHAKDRYDGLVFVNKRNVSKSFPRSDSAGAHVTWTSKYGSVSFNFIASQTSWGGMNEAGLVVSSMRLEQGSKAPRPDARPSLLIHYWVQYMLDNFSTVEEVRESDATVRIISAGRIPHYLVSDRYGNCATIEFIDGTMVSHAKETLPVRALANTPYDRSVAEWQAVLARRKAGKSIPEMGSSSRGRFIRAADRVASFSPTDAEKAVRAAFEILREVSVPGGAGIATCWSIVYDTKNLRVYFKTIVHAETRMIDLLRLDFSCQSLVRMIDVNEKLSGDITASLHDYSFELHSDHALRAAKKYGLDMRPQDLIEHIRAIERFPCRSVSR